MKAFSLMFLAVFLFVTVSAISADGKNWPEGKQKRPDSRVLCYIFTPWPFHNSCKECPDSDGDGVVDRDDRCPNTPAGTKVNKQGCPIETSETEAAFLNTGLIRASNIFFEFEKADLKPESRETLNEIGNILVQWSDLEIEIGGHTDSEGPEEFNKELSAQRAASVFEYLKANFPEIKPENFTVKGYGESKPIAANDTVEGREKNRRVEFRCLNEKEFKKEIDRRRK